MNNTHNTIVSPGEYGEYIREFHSVVTVMGQVLLESNRNGTTSP